MTTVNYKIPNINCHHCVHTIKTELADLQGVSAVDADVTNKTVTIVFEPPATEARIRDLLAEINYPAAA